MAERHRVPIVYVNQYGGNDDLVFDGRSLAFDAAGRPIARGRSFERDILICDLDRPQPIGPAAGSRHRVGDLARARARHARLREEVRVHDAR